jgi:hypothetical protein
MDEASHDQWEPTPYEVRERPGFDIEVRNPEGFLRRG